MNRSRAGIENITGVVVGIIIMVLVIGIAVFLYFYAFKTAGAMGTLSPSGAIINPDGSITITATAAGGDVVMQGLAVYSPSGVIATAGTVPSGVSASTSSCSLKSIYTNGQSYTSFPVTIPTGQSATIILSPGCQGGTSVTIYYNNGKSVSVPIG
ncbi:MAG: hypothetical protein AT718_11435 [Vulcanisaeta sp. JCHS_4]|jgi:hypothetical protein|nr:MAG: hypothetical protein AT718_11435 [Vulcanisaeta sp. JCHS_4]